jgi:hypothetical protein
VACSPFLNSALLSSLIGIHPEALVMKNKSKKLPLLTALSSCRINEVEQDALDAIPLLIDSRGPENIGSDDVEEASVSPRGVVSDLSLHFLHW